MCISVQQRSWAQEHWTILHSVRGSSLTAALFKVSLPLYSTFIYHSCVSGLLSAAHSHTFKQETNGEFMSVLFIRCLHAKGLGYVVFWISNGSYLMCYSKSYLGFILLTLQPWKFHHSSGLKYNHGLDGFICSLCQILRVSWGPVPGWEWKCAHIRLVYKCMEEMGSGID